MTATEFGSKMRSKREVYRFLQSEVLAYLGEYQTMTVWHLRDIVSGDRTLIKASQVKHISIPNFDGLTIEKMLEFAQNYPLALKALPVKEEIKKLNR